MPAQLTRRQKINYTTRLFQCAQLPSVWLQFMSPIRKNSIWPQQHQFHKSAIGHKPQKKTKPSSQCQYFIHNYFFFFCMSVFVFDEQPHNLWKPYDLMNFDGHVWLWIYSNRSWLHSHNKPTSWWSLNSNWFLPPGWWWRPFLMSLLWFALPCLLLLLVLLSSLTLELSLEPGTLAILFQSMLFLSL